MADEKTVRGMVQDLVRSQDDGRLTLHFWVHPTNGSKIPVEVHWDEPLQTGDLVEVTGTSDHEGTLHATALRRAAEPVKAKPGPSLHWPALLLAVLLGRVLAWAVTVLPSELKGSKTLPKTSFLLALAFSLGIVNLRVKERRVLHSGIVAAGTIVLALLMIKC
jgi:hypothetical protein